ncbi:MAG: transposase [Deltaproteobacteria bacterium]|nr:transposase [Deltaproteobacteria bacterium]
MIKKYQKRVRLKEFSYKGCYRYFITIVTDRKNKIFISNEIVDRILEIFKDLSISCQFIVWAYCFMPDHFHVLIEGKSQDSDMKELLSRFKQKTAFEFKKAYQKRLWQENYYEHVLIKDEDTRKAARYIFENPIRKGLVKDVSDYPYIGSFEGSIKDICFSL